MQNVQKTLRLTGMLEALPALRMSGATIAKRK